MMKRSYPLKFILVAFLVFCQVQTKAANAPADDRICGKWTSSEKNLTVLVYKAGNQFKAKIIWFADEPSLPMEEWTDEHNSNPALRRRKVLGMDVLRDLKYDPDSNSWEGGTIYDAKHGKEWNASVYIDKDGLLKVKGYWHFKILGKTLTFTRS